MFTKGHRSTSADIPKNLTANVFNNHFLSVSESLIEPRTNVYECSNPLHDFCKQKTSGQDPFVIPYLSVSELGKYIARLENKKSSSLDGISNQLLKLSLAYIIDSLTYVFNLCIEKKTFFRLSLKKPKWFRFQNLRIKKSNQLQTNITSVCFVKASRKACAHLLKWLLRKAATSSPLSVWI